MSESFGDPFLPLLEAVSDGEQVPDLDSPSVEEDGFLIVESVSKTKLTAKQKRILDGSQYLYGPDYTVAENLGIPPEDVAFTPPADPPARKPIVSKLPLAVVQSPHLREARELCDYLADVRRNFLEAKTRSTNPCVEAADRLLRVHGLTLDEGKSMVDFLASRNGLVKWVTNADDLYWHADEVLTHNSFSLWLTAEGREVRPEIVAQAQSRLDDPNHSRPGRPGKPAAVMGSPSGVRDAEHRTGGRRSVSL